MIGYLGPLKLMFNLNKPKYYPRELAYDYDIVVLKLWQYISTVKNESYNSHIKVLTTPKLTRLRPLAVIEIRSTLIIVYQFLVC